MGETVEYNTGNIGKYQTKNKLKRAMVERFDQRMMRMVLSLPCSSILDAGCGEGFITRQLKDVCQTANVIGLDGAEEALDIARSNNKDIQFVQGNLYALPFEDGTFDLVVCSEVLEHLEKPKRAVEELKRVAKMSILITVPREPWFCIGNLVSLHNVSRLGNPVDHINHWTYRSFQKDMTQWFSEYTRSFDTSFPWSIMLARR